MGSRPHAELENENVGYFSRRKSRKRETIGFELKESPSKTDEDVRLQLQANLYNILVREYMDKMKH